MVFLRLPITFVPILSIEEISLHIGQSIIFKAFVGTPAPLGNVSEVISFYYPLRFAENIIHHFEQLHENSYSLGDVFRFCI